MNTCHFQCDTKTLCCLVGDVEWEWIAKKQCVQKFIGTVHIVMCTCNVDVFDYVFEMCIGYISYIHLNMCLYIIYRYVCNQMNLFFYVTYILCYFMVIIVYHCKSYSIFTVQIYTFDIYYIYIYR